MGVVVGEKVALPQWKLLYRILEGCGGVGGGCSIRFDVLFGYLNGWRRLSVVVSDGVDGIRGLRKVLCSTGLVKVYADAGVVMWIEHTESGLFAAVDNKGGGVNVVIVML